MRTQIRRQQRENEAHMQTIPNEPEHETWTHIEPLLDDALGKLGQKDHDALVLRFFEHKNFSEVGAALGASEDAAKMRVQRALEKLRKFFTQRGVTHSSAAITGAISAHSVTAAPVGLAKTISVLAVAKGATAGTTTLTLVKGALKIMTWTKMKTAVVVSMGAVVLLAGAVVATAISNHLAGDKPTAGEILQQVRRAYDALSSYSDSGNSVMESGRPFRMKFALKLARPDLFSFQGEQSFNGQAPVRATFWPVDSQIFTLVTMGNRTRYTRYDESRDMLLEGVCGDSIASGLSVAGLFFHKMPDGSHWDGSIEKLWASTNVVRQSDEKIAGVNCYVLKMPVMPYSVTLWIGQKDFLIRQRRAVFKGAQPGDNYTFTETHADLMLNKVFSTSDLAPEIPAGVKLETNPVRRMP